jgi:hypothetical protein
LTRRCEAAWEEPTATRPARPPVGNRPGPRHKEEHGGTTAWGPRRDVELALEKAVGELAEHGSGPQREAERGEAERRESAKDRRLKLKNEALQAVPSGRPERDGNDAAVGLVGAKKRSAPKQRPTVDGNGEGPQPPELDAQAVEDKPHEERAEQRRHKGELAHRDLRGIAPTTRASAAGLIPCCAQAEVAPDDAASSNYPVFKGPATL